MNPNIHQANSTDSFLFQSPFTAPSSSLKRKNLCEPSSECIEERIFLLSRHLTKLSGESEKLDSEMKVAKENFQQTIHEIIGSKMYEDQVQAELDIFKDAVGKMKEQLTKNVSDVEELKMKLSEEKKKARENQSNIGQEAIKMLSQYIDHVSKLAKASSEAYGYNIA